MKRVSYGFLKLYYDYLDVGLVKLSEQYLIQDMNTAAHSILAVEEVRCLNQPFSLFLMIHNISVDKTLPKQSVLYQRTPIERLKLIFEQEVVWDTDEQKEVILFTIKPDESAYYGDHVLELLLSHVNDMPVAIYCKDLHGTYVESNRYCNMLANGRKAHDSIIGKVDQDLVWGDYAGSLRENDERVVRGETIISEEQVVLFDNSHQVMRSFKRPFIDASGNLLGLIGLSVPDMLLPGTDKVSSSSMKQSGGSHAALTDREQECLRLLAQGFSVKEVSNCMDISRRTVEAHLGNIKCKTGCYKQFQLGFFLGSTCSI